MSRFDEMFTFLNRNEREAFDRASSQEKIEKLRKYIDELWDVQNLVIEDVEKQEKKYNKLVSVTARTFDRVEDRIGSEVQGGYKIVSTEKILCKAKAGEVHTAILLVHGDGTVTVKCSAKCWDCEYGEPEL